MKDFLTLSGLRSTGSGLGTWGSCVPTWWAELTTSLGCLSQPSLLVPGCLGAAIHL